MTTRDAHCWLNTISLEHVQIGVAGGFTQADHGAASRLRRLRRGDGLVFYSPRTGMRTGQPVQRFTALGVIAGDEPYQVTVNDDFHPWRLAVDFLPAQPAEVRPLLPHLSFITQPDRWGLAFRRGLFQIPESDFERIAEAMDITWPRHADPAAR